jgi:hypothetical protein
MPGRHEGAAASSQPRRAPMTGVKRPRTRRSVLAAVGAVCLVLTACGGTLGSLAALSPLAGSDPGDNLLVPAYRHRRTRAGNRDHPLPMAPNGAPAGALVSSGVPSGCVTCLGGPCQVSHRASVAVSNHQNGLTLAEELLVFLAARALTATLRERSGFRGRAL